MLSCDEKNLEVLSEQDEVYIMSDNDSDSTDGAFTLRYIKGIIASRGNGERNTLLLKILAHRYHVHLRQHGYQEERTAHLEECREGVV